MILGIDASNIRRGGGVTHLCEWLRVAEPAAYGFQSVVVWGGGNTLDQLDNRPWLSKRLPPALDRGLAARTSWAVCSLSSHARAERCDVVFIPGGSFAGTFRPIVALSQNLLPFEWRELRRYGLSPMTAKFLALRLTQGRTFARADGVIFLTEYARCAVSAAVGQISGRMAVIPHGIDRRFRRAPRAQEPITAYSADRPFRILYVSIVDVYKHQDHVATAAGQLHARGLPIRLQLVGPAYAPSLKRLRTAIERAHVEADVIEYSGPVPFLALHERYASADVFVFASSCENLPIVLLEAMASGLPIACSNRGPMPEVLGDAGVYFDPEDPAAIADAIGNLIEYPQLRGRLAAAAFERASALSWNRCAEQTLRFIKEVADGHCRSGT